MTLPRLPFLTSHTTDVIVVPDIYPSLGVSPYWLLEDIAWEYGAGLYGFNWHDNSFSMNHSKHTGQKRGRQTIGNRQTATVGNFHTRRPTHAVVIMVNGFTCRGAEVRRAISNYLLSVF